ncbi:mediator of RNA polymerase II transcription subunit 27-like [Portunus trituberculatus]|uniref:mediator of RNA polymerase II transcription subunit 27-like n=1 Tax=Portunus trituberculatus TaxID=210409 RepID=UPI001E1D1889|nr:mediator of RNA polymerase II transcription subunit 27-like [Portunus trituberculatus]
MFGLRSRAAAASCVFTAVVPRFSKVAGRMAAPEGSSVEVLTVSLNTLRSLRSTVTQFLKTLAEGPKYENDQDGEGDLLEVTTKAMGEIRNKLRELETQMAGLTPSSVPVNLGNTGLLSLDPSPDKLPQYYQLLDCYTYMEKVHSYSTTLHSVLSANNLKRSALSAKRRRPIQLNHNVPQQQVDMLIQGINQMFQDMNLTLSRPFGNNAVVQVALGRVLKAVVTFKGILIEWVVVRAHNESLLDEDGKVDLYTPSQYKVFQKVTDNANAAMLNFCSPGFSDLSVRSFFTWLHSFVSLFNDVCKKCNYHLHNHMPPTWREFRTLDPFHEECKP